MQEPKPAESRRRGRKAPPESHRSATWLAAILAAWVTVLAITFMRDLGPQAWAGWRLVLPTISAVVWLSAWAWWKRRFWLAAPGFCVAAVATSGFFLVMVVALSLSVAAVYAAIRDMAFKRAQIEK